MTRAFNSPIPPASTENVVPLVVLTLLSDPIVMAMFDAPVLFISKCPSLTQPLGTETKLSVDMVKVVSVFIVAIVKNVLKVKLERVLTLVKQRQPCRALKGQLICRRAVS